MSPPPYVITSSSADHWALAVYSRKIRPATAQLKSPGKLTTWNKRERCERRVSGVVKVTDVDGGGNKKKKRELCVIIYQFVPPPSFYKDKQQRYITPAAFVKDQKLDRKKIKKENDGTGKAGNQR